MAVLVLVKAVETVEGVEDRGSVAVVSDAAADARGLNWKRVFDFSLLVASFSFSVRPLIA